ncbi:glycosyltransferase family 4 protein [Planosporangium sp. 12N6]|uniref:glycosyltransferase family 4 protein n=1 Tax=Planosporangium spinosum TaxID=3402278 RepID=UPI003CEE9C31
MYTATHVAPVVTAAGASLVLAAGFTEVMRRFALRSGLTDRPAAHKPHARPTPYLGGVAVAAGALLTALVLVPRWDTGLVALAVGGLVVAVLGLLDDAWTLPPGPRLAVEVAVAGLFVTSGARVPVSGLAWFDAVLTAGWLVVLTNSFNLLDNTDGAAGSIATGTAAVLAVYALVNGEPGLAVLLAGLAAAAGGFLSQNWPPARIFMGDAGSLFLGFTLAGATVLLTDRADAPVDGPTVLLLVTFIATVDTTLVLISRRAAGRRWLDGGTDHVAHRLRRLGLSRPLVPGVLVAASVVTSVFGMLVVSDALPGTPVLLTALAAGAVAVGLLLRVPVYGPAAGQPVAAPVADGATFVDLAAADGATFVDLAAADGATLVDLAAADGATVVTRPGAAVDPGRA